MQRNKTKGFYFAFATALVSGFSIFINKFAVVAIKEPLIFTATRNTLVSLLLLAIIVFKKNFKELKKLSSKDFLFLVSIGIVGGSIPFYLFFTGLSQIPAINGAIIHKTLVLWVTILAIPFLKEKLSKETFLVVFTLFFANILVGGFKGFEFSKGEFLVLVATILWAVENVMAKKILSKVNPNLVIEARMGIGALILLTLSFILKPQALFSLGNLNATNWMWILITSLLLFSYVYFWYRGLKYLPAITATAVLTGSTLITNILSAIFVTHTLNTLTLIQSALIAIGIIALYKLELSLKETKNIKLETSY